MEKLMIRRLDNAVVQVDPESLDVLKWGLQRRVEIAAQIAKLQADLEVINSALIETFVKSGIKSATQEGVATITYIEGAKGKTSVPTKALVAALLDRKVGANVIEESVKAATVIGKPGKPQVKLFLAEWEEPND